MNRLPGLRMAMCLATLTILLAPGCAAQRRPEAATPPAPAPAAPAAPAPAAPDANVGAPEAAHARSVASVATQVSGVRRAWAVVVGNVAYIGVDLHGEAARRPDANGAVEQQIANAVTQSNLGITQAFVTTKPEVVQSIQNIFLGLEQGRPLSQFTAEIAKLAAELVPAVGS